MTPDVALGVRAGFTRALAAEWIKLWSVRSTAWMAPVIAVLTIALALFVALTESLGPADTIVSGSLTGAMVSLLVAGVLGALVMSNEYGSGTIQPTLTAVPRRLTVLTAKTVLVAAVVFAVAVPAGLAAYGVGTMVLDTEVYASGSVVNAVLGVALSHSVVAAAGVAIGVLFRHGAAAVAAVLCGILLPSLLAPLFGGWQQWVAGVSPLTAAQKLAQSTDVTGGLPAWPSFGVLVASTGVLWALAAVRLRDRDT